MLVLDKITKKIGLRVLFEDVSISFNAGHRYGLTGPNGAGKSTLVKIMMGIEDATSGNVSLPKSVGYLKQNIADFKDMMVMDVVIMGNERLSKALRKQEELYAQEMTDEIGIQLAELEEVVAEEDGYNAESAAEILLEGIGITPEERILNMSALPTDRQFKVLLCQALFGNPEALLLDEPTNHLDLNSIQWLEKFLYNYEGTVIVISHDRHFLNAVCSDIADIDYETIILYPGNYDDMLATKSETRQKAEEESKSKEKKIQALRKFVDKFSAGTRASQVQSRLKEINRLKPQELKKSNIQRPYIRFMEPAQKPGQLIYKIQDLHKAFDGNEVIDGFSIEVHRNDKIAVIGNNGMGKSTLLRMIAGVLEPDQGSIELGHNVQTGYFPQDHADTLDKKEKISLFDWLRDREDKASDQEIRSALGKLLFSQDDAFKTLPQLSGGETARLITANLMLKPYNTLILDEPNNHLDIEAVTALGIGLQLFDGTVLFASHDRDLISTVATRIIAIEKDQIRVYNGSYDEFYATHASS